MNVKIKGHYSRNIVWVSVLYMPLSLLFFFFFLLLCSIPRSSYAEVIYLKSGKTIEGNIVERTAKYIRIALSGVEVTYFLDEIDRIEEATVSPSQSSSGNMVIGRGQAKLDQILERIRANTPKAIHLTGITTQQGSIIIKGFMTAENGQDASELNHYVFQLKDLFGIERSIKSIQIESLYRSEQTGSSQFTLSLSVSPSALNAETKESNSADTALLEAARKGDMQGVSQTLSQGAGVNINGKRIPKKENKEVKSALLKKSWFEPSQADKEQQTLQQLKPSAEQGDADATLIVAALYMKGYGVTFAPEEAGRLLLKASQIGKPSHKKISPFEMDHLITLAISGREVYHADITEEQGAQILKFLLDSGADPNWGLFEAVGMNRVQHVKLLLKYGANVNAYKEKENGQTPLARAIETEKVSVEIVKALLAAGADVRVHNRRIRDAKGNSPTLLSEAAWRGRSDLVKLLLEKGVDINERGIEGKTALMSAAYAGHKDTVQLLLDRGANPNLVDARGKTAMQHAQECSWREIAELLKRAVDSR